MKPPRKKKESNIVESTSLAKYMLENNINQDSFAKLLGVTGSCIGNWRKQGTMPALAEPAMSWLNHLNKIPEPVNAVIITGNNDDIEFIKTMAIKLMSLKCLPLSFDRD